VAANKLAGVVRRLHTTRRLRAPVVAGSTRQRGTCWKLMVAHQFRLGAGAGACARDADRECNWEVT
jgi:hypothetical protein